MNVVFISPHFPLYYWNFCDRLKRRGVNVLGIGDAAYDSISEECKNSLTEYYKVDSLENYDEVYRACGYFTHKYGKIDWIESEKRHIGTAELMRKAVEYDMYSSFRRSGALFNNVLKEHNETYK